MLMWQAAANAAGEAASARAEQLVGKLRAAVRKGKALEAHRDELVAEVSTLPEGLSTVRVNKSVFVADFC